MRFDSIWKSSWVRSFVLLSTVLFFELGSLPAYAADPESEIFLSESVNQLNLIQQEIAYELGDLVMTKYCGQEWVAMTRYLSEVSPNQSRATLADLKAQKDVFLNELFQECRNQKRVLNLEERFQRLVKKTTENRIKELTEIIAQQGLDPGRKLFDIPVKQLSLYRKVASEFMAQLDSNQKSCPVCNKKIGLLGIPCGCEWSFCQAHHFPSEHPCSRDYKTERREHLKQTLPHVVAEKIVKIGPHT